MNVLGVIVKCTSYRYLKGRSWLAFLFLIIACTMDGGGLERELVRKMKGGPNLVHNKYNTIGLWVWPTIGLSFIRYKNKTTFVCGDHFVCDGRSPWPRELRWCPSTTNSVISSHSSPDCGSFIIIFSCTQHIHIYAELKMSDSIPSLYYFNWQPTGGELYQVIVKVEYVDPFSHIPTMLSAIKPIQ